jgi:hypothetical protein
MKPKWNSRRRGAKESNVEVAGIIVCVPIGSCVGAVEGNSIEIL